MLAGVVVDVIDVHRLLIAALKAKYPELEPVAIRVVSWNQTVLNFDHEMLTEPIRHRLKSENAVLTKEQP